MKKVKKLISIIIAGLIVVFALTLGAFYWKRNDLYRGFFMVADSMILEKEMVTEDNETAYYLTIKQPYNGEEYTFRLELAGSWDEQSALYGGLRTGEIYNHITYSYKIPKKIVVQNGLEPYGGFDALVLLEYPDMAEKYLKVQSVGAD